MGNYLFKKEIGIPIGSDPAPFFDNIFLYHYERQWLLNLKKKDLAKARNGGEFEKHYGEIYPEEMQLGKENKDNNTHYF